ncbi:Nsi1p NDAI_0A05820 [Naumovozyma dairenensis CBS 421]|uniref:DNA-binding protein REB1 n=1 Tax=Naumovozyma dairenensis (strain ATCC 10597 / BCRC 20456 / CBS 421 / NBRC 0211 / NRRL Y-12639) TaxID=1071378 RepID=G0W4J9_NAUDC|nr:hypothetical protein NDAI_0A05820 [Naumovozyma dairenensis CBS 421]CCD22737.1 hypothetical protein NDAI_0A05820 [Naumovozyma dairenensis CBS 421]
MMSEQYSHADNYTVDDNHSVEEAVFRFVGEQPNPDEKRIKKEQRRKHKKHKHKNKSKREDDNAADVDNNIHIQENDEESLLLNLNDIDQHMEVKSDPQTHAIEAIAAAYDAEKKRKRHMKEIDTGNGAELNNEVERKRSKRSKRRSKDKKAKHNEIAVDPELESLGQLNQSAADIDAYINTESTEESKVTDRTGVETNEGKTEDKGYEFSTGVGSAIGKQENGPESIDASTEKESGVDHVEIPLTREEKRAIAAQERILREHDNKLIASAAAAASKNVPSNTSGGKVFDPNEEHALDEFIEQYRRIKGFTMRQTKERIWTPGRKKDDFWINICKVLPFRSRSSIYKHVRRRYHIFEQRGKWTPEEDQELARLCIQKEGLWSDIGKALGRMPEDCRDRWRNYIKCGSNRVANKWSKEEEELLKSVIAQIIQEAHNYRILREKAAEEGVADESLSEVSPEARGPKGKKIHGRPGFKDIINWTVVSERMGGTRSRIQCRYKWSKLARKQAMSKIVNMTQSDKLWLLERLRDLGFTADSQVDWDELSITKSGTKWSALELKLCYEKMRGVVKDFKHKKMNDIVLELLDILHNQVQ